MIVEDWCPIAWAAFRDYRLNALQLSATETRLLLSALAGDEAAVEAALPSKRERDVFWGKVERIRSEAATG